MEARLVLREGSSAKFEIIQFHLLSDALLICTVDQDLALLPYPSITYIYIDESLETPDHLLGIIAVIPEMPPNCILIYSEDSQGNGSIMQLLGFTAAFMNHKKILWPKLLRKRVFQLAKRKKRMKKSLPEDLSRTSFSKY